MKPTKSVLDRGFRYTNAAMTNVRKTWDRLVPGWNKRKNPKAVVHEIAKARKVKQ